MNKGRRGTFSRTGISRQEVYIVNCFFMHNTEHQEENENEKTDIRARKLMRNRTNDNPRNPRKQTLLKNVQATRTTVDRIAIRYNLTICDCPKIEWMRIDVAKRGKHGVGKRGIQCIDDAYIQLVKIVGR